MGSAIGRSQDSSTETVSRAWAAAYWSILVRHPRSSSGSWSRARSPAAWRSFRRPGSCGLFRKTPRCPEIHVCIPERRRAGNRPGIVVHRCRDLPATDVVTRADGVRLTSPPRTIFDAAASVSPTDLESMIEQGLDRANFTLPTLWRQCNRLRINGRSGGARLADVLRSRPSWRRPARSDYELRLERAMRRTWLPTACSRACRRDHAGCSDPS